MVVCMYCCFLVCVWWLKVWLCGHQHSNLVWSVRQQKRMLDCRFWNCQMELVIYVYRDTYILHWHMFMSVFATVCINMHNYVVFLYQTTAWPNMICFMLHKIIPCCTVDAWGSHICCGRSSTLRSWYILSLPTSSDSRWDGPRAHNFGWHVSSLDRNCIYCILFIG